MFGEMLTLLADEMCSKLLLKFDVAGRDPTILPIILEKTPE